MAAFWFIVGVYIEKGMGLVIPGFVPDVLHEIYEYSPTGVERLLSMSIWATGLFIFTVLLRVAIPILNGDFHVAADGVGSCTGDQMFIIGPVIKQRAEEDNAAAGRRRQVTNSPLRYGSCACVVSEGAKI